MSNEKKLNKFEETRLFSARAVEISEGDKPKVKISNKETLLTKDYVNIAKEEFEKGKLELEIYEE